MLLTALCLWRRSARLLRVLAVATNVVVIALYGIFLSNVGRNTFEHTQSLAFKVDRFEEGVFAEAKAADSFARAQLPTLYMMVACLSVMAIWPAIAKRRNQSSDRARELPRREPDSS